MRRNSYLAVLALAFTVAVSAGVLAGCGASKGSFKGHGISFTYPQSWARAQFAGLSAQNAGALWTEAFRPPSASKADLVFVSEYQTPVPITKQKLSAYAPIIASSVSKVAKKAGGALLAGPKLVSMGGLPGYSFRISAKTIHGLSSESRILLVWNGTTEYYLNCQHESPGKATAEIERGCKIIIASFKLSS